MARGIGSCFYPRPAAGRSTQGRQCPVVVYPRTPRRTADPQQRVDSRREPFRIPSSRTPAKNKFSEEGHSFQSSRESAQSPRWRQGCRLWRMCARDLLVLLTDHQWLAMDRLQAKGIANPDEVIHCGGRQAYPDMQIELLSGRWFPGGTDVHKMPGPSPFRKVARIFGKCIPALPELPVHQECGPARHVATTFLCRPIHCEHACSRPVGRQRSRPGHLHGGIIAMTRNGPSAGRQAERQDQRNVKACCRAQLPLHPDGKVAKSGARSRARLDLAEVVRSSQTQFGFRHYPETQQRLRAIEGALPLAHGFCEPVLSLETPGRDG